MKILLMPKHILTISSIPYPPKICYYWMIWKQRKNLRLKLAHSSTEYMVLSDTQTLKATFVHSTLIFRNNASSKKEYCTRIFFADSPKLTTLIICLQKQIAVERSYPPPPHHTKHLAQIMVPLPRSHRAIQLLRPILLR